MGSAHRLGVDLGPVVRLTSEGGLGNNMSSPPANPSILSNPNTNNNNVVSGVGLPKSPFAQSQDTSFGGAQVNTNSPFGNNSPFGGGPTSLQNNDNNNNAFGSASASGIGHATGNTRGITSKCSTTGRRYLARIHHPSWPLARSILHDDHFHRLLKRNTPRIGITNGQARHAVWSDHDAKGRSGGIAR